MDNILYPQPIRCGDTIAIVSPASIIDPRLVEGAASTLRLLGYRVRVGKHALGASGSYSGTADERLGDIRQAFLDDDVKAILCSRGGYGCVHLLDRLSHIDLRRHAKWLIGFSDVSALHAMMASQGVVSIHGSMAKALAQHPHAAPFNAMLLNMLQGRRPELQFAPHPFNRCGVAEGRLLGGNLAVLQALVGTPFDILRDAVLFIEDIAEPIYKVERILCQLKLSGRLNSLKGIVIGQFTLCEPDRNYHDINHMILDMLAGIDIPAAYNAPIGHIAANMPLLHGANVSLNVSPALSTISYC